jgi:hypothetical protein
MSDEERKQLSQIGYEMMKTNYDTMSDEDKIKFTEGMEIAENVVEMAHHPEKFTEEDKQKASVGLLSSLRVAFLQSSEEEQRDTRVSLMAGGFNPDFVEDFFKKEVTAEELLPQLTQQRQQTSELQQEPPNGSNDKTSQ